MSQQDSAPTPGTLAGGFRLPFEALGVLRRERRLWPLALLPVLLSLAAFGVSVGLIAANAAELYGWATDWLPSLSAERWYEWIWVGPARAALAALGAGLFLGLVAVCLVAAYLVASVLASPVHDVLAARVEQILTGAVVEEGAGGVRALLREGGRSMREELKRTLFFLGLTLPLIAVGFLVPGAQLLTGPILLGITILFLPLEYSSYTLDRRRVSFEAKRGWLLAHRSVMLGFGGAAFMTFSIPGLNFLAMPVLVVAGTLLALRLGPPGAVDAATEDSSA
jgi:uncharacterized protein involved in cysteine biosynthesis